MLLPLDLETTGLRPDTDRILEVAWTVVHDDLSEHMVDIRSHVVTPSIAAWQLIEENDFIENMHGKTGLPETLELSDVEENILSDINAGMPEDEPLYLFGASVHFDLNFIRNWMPRLAARLSHRVYDTSTLKAFMKDFIALPSSIENQNAHRAANDVQEVLDIARHYRIQMVVAQTLIDRYIRLGVTTRADEAQL